MERARLTLALVSSLALLGCGSALPVVSPGAAASGTAPSRDGSTNVRDTGARPTPAVIADALDREGTVRGLIDPQRGLVVVSAYEDDDGEVRQASRQCGAELSRTVRTLDAHLEDDGSLRCSADTCKDPSLRASDPNRVFVFRPDPRRGVVLEAVLLLGDVGLSERGFEAELEWGRGQIAAQRSAACSD